MKYTAINDSVILEMPDEEASKQTKTESGIFLIEKDATTGTTVTATVVSVGEGKFDYKIGAYVKPPVEVGDKVIVSSSTGMKLDARHRMVRTDDIFAKVASA